MVLAAVEHWEPEGRRLVDDDLAASFLPLPLRLFVGTMRWTPLRHGVIRASERSGPGLWANIACRKRYIDDMLAVTIGEIDAVVVLGAGLDTRAYRLARRNGIPVFEVDQQVNVARKRAVVARALGTPPSSVRLVPVDFERDDLIGALRANGYRPDFRTFFIWEGVTQYLTADAVTATLDQLASAATGSRLHFTYVRRDFIDGDELYGSPALYRKFRGLEPVWKFGLDPEHVAEFLAGYGWRLIEQAGPAEFTSRYMQPSGRDLVTSQLEWSAHAAKA